MEPGGTSQVGRAWWGPGKNEAACTRSRGRRTYEVSARGNRSTGLSERGRGRGGHTTDQIFNSQTEKHSTNVKPHKKDQCFHGSVSLSGMNHSDSDSLAQSL